MDELISYVGTMIALDTQVVNEYFPATRVLLFIESPELI